MGFGEKVKQFVSGKTEIERKQESAAMTEIRKKVFAAQLKERESQAIRFAQEKEKHEYAKRLNQLRTPKRFGFTNVAPEYSKYGSPFGQPRNLQSQRRVVKIITKGKKGKRKVRYVQEQPRQAPPQEYIDMLGFGNLRRKDNKKYDVLGF